MLGFQGHHLATFGIQNTKLNCTCFLCNSLISTENPYKKFRLFLVLFKLSFLIVYKVVILWLQNIQWDFTRRNYLRRKCLLLWLSGNDLSPVLKFVLIFLQKRKKINHTTLEGTEVSPGISSAKCVRESDLSHYTTSECVCANSSEWECPLTGCVCQGPSRPSGGGPGAAVTLLKGRHAMCLWARASCAAWSGSPGTWAAGRGEDGVRVGDRKQRRSALCLHWLMELGRGDKVHPFPPLPIGAIIHIILANQKTSNKVTPQMDVTAYGTPTTTQFPD